MQSTQRAFCARHLKQLAGLSGWAIQTDSVAWFCHLCFRPVPGFVNQTIFSDTIQPGWNWYPYDAKNTVLLAKGQGVAGSTATCATLSKGGGLQLKCKGCSRPGYQPFAKAKSLEFDIRSNTQSDDEFASSTPRGQLPPVKLFMMNVSELRHSTVQCVTCDELDKDTP